MGESSAVSGSADGETSEAASSSTGKSSVSEAAARHADGPTIVNVVQDGDIILDLTFETSKETLQRSRKEALNAARKAGAGRTNGNSSNGVTNGSISRPLITPASLKPRVRIAYRVSLAALKKGSKYFANLLSNAQFNEAKVITDTHARLTSMGLKPSEAPAEDLPWITITDDDEATRTAGREHVFEDMLRCIHQLTPKTLAAAASSAARASTTMSHAATLAVLADRFDCAPAVSRAINQDVKLKWPATSSRPMYDEQGRPTETEQVLRQKVLVAWLLGHPMRLPQASRELIIRGSRRWGAFRIEEDEEDGDSGMTAAWWNLPDGLEDELQYRRECILNTIASIQRHFLALYSSRTRQCKLGYDSSPACDSFQLGQLLRFLTSKNLLSLVDFGPSSVHALLFPSTASSASSSASATQIDAEELLTTLKQLPGYQVDKHHTNCGPRVRVDPILDYIRAMLSATVVSIPHAEWQRHRADVSWVIARDQRYEDGQGHGKGFGFGDEAQGRTFAFTRAMANDQRLKMAGLVHTDRLARDLFTADAWDWTPEA